MNSAQLIQHLQFYKFPSNKLSLKVDLEEALMIINAGTRKLIQTTEKSTTVS